MRFSPKLAWCTLVLLLVPSLAWAGDVTLAAWAEKTVRDGLVKPLSTPPDYATLFTNDFLP